MGWERNQRELNEATKRDRIKETTFQLALDCNDECLFDLFIFSPE